MSERMRRMATGAGWLYGYRWSERLIDFVTIVVLARLLTPADFGLVAIAASVATIIEGLSDFDVNKARIRSRDDARSLYDTAWTLSALRGLLTALIMILIAATLPDGRIAPVLMALAPSPLFKGLANPRFVAFERDLVYSRVAGLTLAAKLAAFAVTVTVAVMTRSYWALVLGILAGSLVSLILSYAMRPYLPRVRFTRSREIFAFSGWMSLATMVTTLSMETDKLIVGRLLGVADAGFYFMTQRVGVLPTRELISPLQRLLFPSFSEIADDRNRLRSSVSESINVLASLSLPAGCGFALVAGDFVPLVLGEDWLPIIPLLMILVPFLGLRGTLSMALPSVMALGMTRLLFQVSLVYALVHVPAFVLGTLYFGLTGAVTSIVVAGLFYTYLNAWILGRTLGIGAGEIAHRMRRPLAATAVLVGTVSALGKASAVDWVSAVDWASAVDRQGLPVWAMLLTKVGIGGIVYTTALYVFWRLEGRPSGIERRLLALRSDRE